MIDETFSGHPGQIPWHRDQGPGPDAPRETSEAKIAQQAETRADTKPLKLAWHRGETEELLWWFGTKTEHLAEIDGRGWSWRWTAFRGARHDLGERSRVTMHLLTAKRDAERYVRVRLAGEQVTP